MRGNPKPEPRLGSRNGQAILDEDKVRYIRKHYKPFSRRFGGIALAKRFGVSRDCIYQVVYYINWRHVE